MSTNDVIQGIYIAYYGRFADAGGLAYWSARLDAEGGNLDNVINYFGNSPEAETLFGSMTNTAKINYIYNTLFGRDGDADGVEFYTDMLTAGTASAADIAKRIADGAQGTDATAIDNKVAAANSLTASVSASEYSGDAAAAAGRALIAQVDDTHTAPTSTWAQALATGGQTEGSTFTLTTSSTRDTVSGSAANDTIDGTVLDSVESDTIIDGSSTDTDTMNLVVSGSINPTQAIGIENVNVTAKYGSATVTGANYIGTELVTVSSAITSGSVTVSGASSSTIAAVKASTNIASLSVASGAAGTGTGVSVDAGAATTVTLTGTASVNDVFALSLHGGSTALTTTTLDGTSDKVTITGDTAANTVTVTTGAKTIVAAGGQDMTIKGAAAVFAGNTVTNSLDTGKTLSAVVTAASAAADLSKVSANSIELQALSTSATFADNANVKLNAADLAGALIGTTGATTLNVDVLKASNTGALTNSTLTAFNVTANTVDVTSLNLQAGTSATVALSGSKAVTLNAAYTAKSVDASALTGVLTATALGETGRVNITGGSGNDVLSFGTIAAEATVIGGTGDDTINIGALGAFKLTIDGGEGTNTLKLSASSDFTSGNGASADAGTTSVVTNIDNIDLNANTLEITQKQLFTNGSFTLKDTSTGGTTGTLKVYADGASSNLFDLSGMTFSGVKTANVAITSAAAAASTVVGSSGADSITGGTAADTISGGTGSDTISGGGGSDTLVGGAGGDSITGGSGTDSIDGGDGADTILGAAGNDTMIGAGGGDTFVLNLAAATGSDTIYLGASSGTLTDDAGDIVKFSGNAAASMANVDGTTDAPHIYGFESGTGSDVIQFQAGLLARGSDGETSVATAVSASSIYDITKGAFDAATDWDAISASYIFVEVSGTADVAAASALTASYAWAAIAGATDATAVTDVVSSADVIFAVDDGTDTYLWYFTSSNETASSGDIALVGVIHGVTDLSNGDLVGLVA